MDQRLMQAFQEYPSLIEKYKSGRYTTLELIQEYYILRGQQYPNRCAPANHNVLAVLTEEIQSLKSHELDITGVLTPVEIDEAEPKVRSKRKGK
jgi:hypothetical protein